MKQYEERSSLQQPEGHEGEQVNFYNNGVLASAQIVTRNPHAYLAVSFAGERDFSDAPVDALPRLQIGWHTSLDQETFLEKMGVLFADSKIDEFSWQWMQDDEPAPYSKIKEDVFRHKREQVAIHFDDHETVSWQNRPPHNKPQVIFHTLDSFDMVNGTITQIMQETATHEYRSAILASMDPFKEFYKQYVEIDLGASVAAE